MDWFFYSRETLVRSGYKCYKTHEGDSSWNMDIFDMLWDTVFSDVYESIRYIHTQQHVTRSQKWGLTLLHWHQQKQHWKLLLNPWILWAVLRSQILRPIFFQMFHAWHAMHRISWFVYKLCAIRIHDEATGNSVRKCFFFAVGDAHAHFIGKIELEIHDWLVVWTIGYFSIYWE